MFIDCGNVINLDSDSDEMPSTFLKEQTPIIKVHTFLYFLSGKGCQKR